VSKQANTQAKLNTLGKDQQTKFNH